MSYTIGEAAKLAGVTTSTLRYYDKEGLLPFVQRSSGGIRVFQNSDFEWLRVIECLKKAGLPLKDIRNYIMLALQGDSTIDQRLSLFQHQREEVKKQMDDLQHTLDTLEYKCWYYETAKEAGTTDVHRTIKEEDVPEHLQAIRNELKKDPSA